jgi:hypothetical protein
MFSTLANSSVSSLLPIFVRAAPSTAPFGLLSSFRMLMCWEKLFLGNAANARLARAAIWEKLFSAI